MYYDMFYIVRFQVLTAASMMFRAVFWVVLPCTTQKTALNIMFYILGLGPVRINGM
jgi:hypothetical protein